MLTRFREPTSGFTHLFAALLSIAGMTWLMWLTRTDPTRMLAVGLFGFCMVFVFMASAVFHLSHGSPRKLNTLVRIDLVGIYLMIAGTYTPLCYHFLSGWWRWGMLTAIWTLAIFGSIYVVFFHQRSTRRKILLVLFYVGMGCQGVLGFPYFITILPTGALALILAGGISFLIGAVIFTIDKPNLHPYFNAHDLWHIFVMIGAACFFTTILLHVAMV